MCIHKPNQFVTYLRESYNKTLINIIFTPLTTSLMLWPDPTAFSNIKFSIKCSSSSSASKRLTAKHPYYIAYILTPVQ